MADTDLYPPGFPVPAEDYDEYPNEAFGIDASPLRYTEEEDRQDDLRTRKLTSLYPYEFLDPSKTRSDAGFMQEPVGLLRKEMVQKMGHNGTDGDWTLAEFVPAWTDPDWSDRFVFTGSTDPDNHQVQMYVKPGLLQRQRPALLPSDIAIRGPSEVARRFGIDPVHQDDPYYSRSGITPTTPKFGVPLVYPRETPSNQGQKDKIDVDDLTALAMQFENDARAQGEDTSKDNLRTHLLSAARDAPTNLVKVDTEIAGALLSVMDQVHRREEQEEYQRLLLAGNTSKDLVSNNVWTIGMNAATDLATPLHELLTPDKWEITDMRSELDLDTGEHSRPRTVYNISEQQGEYCMNDDLVRAALQPALQMVSKVLYSDHPVTWAWADIYRLRPIRDGRAPSPEHRRSRITETHLDHGVSDQEWFAMWLGDYDSQNWFPEVAALYNAGFDSVKYVCEILKRTIIWEINSKYGADDYGMSGDQQRMGFTQFNPHPADPSQPFGIRISISADYIWPLLVKEYSGAEKAACSFTLAAIMLHELSHAIVIARQQILHPSCAWLDFDPQWATEIHHTVIESLITFGYRFLEHTSTEDQWWYDTEEMDFLEGESKNEEGLATENQYFGGVATAMAAGTGTRFIDDLTIMGCLELWPHFRGKKVVPSTLQAIPRDMILKFFSEQFWTHDMAKWGHQAMKIWPQEAPKMMATWGDFSWGLVERKFGRPARRWMRSVYHRMRHDDDHAILWRWLYYQTVRAVEPVLLIVRWRRHHESWKTTDKALWTARNACSDRAAAAQAYLQQLLNEVNAWDGTSSLPDPQIEPFRDCLSAMWALHRDLSTEAGIYQGMVVDYHVQSDLAVKDTIQQLWGAIMHTRLSAIHTAIADDCIQFLDDFLNIDPRVLDRLATVPQLVDLLTTGRNAIRANFAAVREVFNPILRTFGQGSEDEYIFRPEDFPGVASGSVLDIAKRIERMAQRQLRELDGPARIVAEGWLNLLSTGEKLLNAVPGSPAAFVSQNLDSVADFIDRLTTAQEHLVAAQYPDPAQPQEVQQPLLRHNQPRPDGTERVQRFVTSPPGQPPNAWQTLYAEASGYIPYEDPRTGFTLFDRIDIPNESNVQAELAARGLMQGADLAGAMGDAIFGIAAPMFPGVNNSNSSSEVSEAQLAVMQGLAAGAHLRGANNPAAPAVQPSARAVQLSQVARGLADLIQARAEQLQANPELAGRVVPSVFNQTLQQLAGRSGENFTGTNVPGDSNLFGGSMAQRNRALQNLEELIRLRAMGANPLAPGADPEFQDAQPPQ